MAINSVKDVETVLALQGRNAGLIIGNPPEDWTSASAVQLTGTINGTNKNFVFPDTHIVFPKGCVSLAPQPADIIIFGKKGSTYTEITGKTAITKSDNELTARQEYHTVELTTAPEAANVDSVWGVCVRQLEPYIQQNIKVETKQDSKEYGQLRSDVKHKTYGAILNTITQDSLLGDLDILLELFFEEYDGIEDIPANTEVFQQTSEPKVLYAFIPLEKGTDIVGFMMFPQVRAVCKSLLDVKEGDNIGYSVELPVDTRVQIVRSTA